MMGRGGGDDAATITGGLKTPAYGLVPQTMPRGISSH